MVSFYQELKYLGDWCLDTKLHRLIEFHYTVDMLVAISLVFTYQTYPIWIVGMFEDYICVSSGVLEEVCGVNHVTVFVFLNCELSRVMHVLCFTPCTGPSSLAVLRTVSVLLPSWPPLATSSTQQMLPMSKDRDNCYCHNSGNTILCIIQVLQTQRNFLWFRSHHQILLMPVIWWRPSTRFSHITTCLNLNSR